MRQYRKVLVFAHKVYTMKYVGRTKVGKIKPNPSTKLAIIRLPVDMKEKAGKWAHIWKVDEDTIVVRFSESKEIDEIPSVYFDVQQAVSGNIEERLGRLESAVEELKNIVLGKSNTGGVRVEEEKCSGRDLNPGHGIESPV